MEASSIYHALAVKAERRAVRGVTLLASYVYSRLTDQSATRKAASASSTPYDLEAERSRSEYDVPHRVVVSAVYELPFGRDAALRARLVAAGRRPAGRMDGERDR